MGAWRPSTSQSNLRRRPRSTTRQGDLVATGAGTFRYFKKASASEARDFGTRRRRNATSLFNACIKTVTGGGGRCGIAPTGFRVDASVLPITAGRDNPLVRTA